MNFRVVDGRVYHQGMQIPDGRRACCTTEGSVGLDETVALVVRVPIQDKWIEGQALLVGLKGQSLAIPISGTLASAADGPKRRGRPVAAIAARCGPAGDRRRAEQGAR